MAEFDASRTDAASDEDSQAAVQQGSCLAAKPVHGSSFDYCVSAHSIVLWFQLQGVL